MTLTSCFSPILPSVQQPQCCWQQPPGASLPLCIVETLLLSKRPVLLIAKDIQHANQYLEELQFFLTDNKAAPSVTLFPDWETLPYDQFSPHQDIISDRLRALANMTQMSNQLVITSINTVMQRLAPTHFISQNSFTFKIGEELSIQTLQQRLVKNHYHSVSQVMEHGEFSVRGSIIDIFPMGCHEPVRIDLLDETIDTIRWFDPETQLTTEKVESIEVLPAAEYPMTEQGITQFRKSWRSEFSGNPIHCPIYEDISQGLKSAGVEYYLPLFFDETATLFDYLPANSLIIHFDSNLESAEEFWKEINERYTQRNFDITRPLLAPPHVYLTVPELFQQVKRFQRITVQTDGSSSQGVSFNAEKAPPYQVKNHADNPLSTLSAHLDEFSGRILISAESPGRVDVLQELLHNGKHYPKQVDSWNQFINQDIKLAITHSPLIEGMLLQDPSLEIITETQLFGHAIIQQRQRRQRRGGDMDTIVRDLTELKIGSPVVHLDHGVGRYRGLTTITTGDVTAEYLTLEYQETSKIYVPVTALHLVSRYTGLDPELAPLDKLGSDKWQKAKRKALTNIRDVAIELLEIYAKREIETGYNFTLPDSYTNFIAHFPYEETPDQTRAIEEVTRDLTSPKKCDRLVCGDVGFGKTEVAMRAAFIAALNGKQVAILVPTTLLASQHYQTFCDRFADFPVHFGLLSRLKTTKEQQETLEGLNNGRIDIVIGTHRILQKDVKFKNLGLVIIDEEHRFGVKQKEILKKMRAEVDMLALTATPIPRTLNLSLTGLRDISIISTPPLKRLSVRTFCYERNNGIIREALLREILRGGQVFFIHNRVETIDRVRQEIAELIPEAKVRSAHGQMHEREMEQIMRDFYHHRFQVLVCTTIVENGIDIPTANTIIIDRADRFGIAQLHQLRGRVGRSHHQAYAYLMIPDKKLISKDAEKRLDAFLSLTDLGAGFNLSMHDLEIRGAGEILGEEQSGNIEAIGFSLYMEILDRTVKAMKSGKTSELSKSLDTGPEINLQLSAYIPENYIPDIHYRLIEYKRISHADSEETLRDIQVALINRFGLLPNEVKNLLRVTELSLKARKLGVKKIEGNPKSIRFEFEKEPNINPKNLIKLIQTMPKLYQFDKEQRLRFLKDSENPTDRIQYVHTVFSALVADPK